jgi:ATP-binding cassette subfamily B protein
MAHATNDIHHVRMASGMGIVAITDAFVLGSAAVFFMALINLRLTVLVLIPMPLIVFLARFFTRRLHARYRAVQAAFADMTEVVRERLAGIRIIQADNRETESRLRLEEISETYIRNNMRLAYVIGVFFPLSAFCTNLSLAVVLYFGGRQTVFATITPGDFVAFINYLSLITWPMMALGWATNLVQRGMASLDRLRDILETRPAVIAPANPVRMQRFSRDIHFSNVSFSYSGENRGAEVLSNIDLRVRAGETLGIVGPPGSGKTTLLRLIPRLYDVTAGHIQVDGIDLKALDPTDLRRQIAYVPQEPFLFAGTIRENVAFGALDAKLDAIHQALAGAALTETIREMPAGLDTMVGERGVVLSGGQKQRIALARALFHRAPVLLLDDPVSQVDAKTGEAVVDTLQSLSRDRTLFIVSHRVSALAFAGRIITLMDGRIAENGTPEMLLHAGGYYARTRALQDLEAAYHVV